jgi:exosortase
MEKKRQLGTWWHWGAALVAVGACYYPTLAWMVRTWLGSPYYAHGFLIPVIFAALAWRLQRSFEPAPESQMGAKGPFWVGMALIAASLGVHFFSLARELYLISGVTFVLVLAGVVLAWAGPGTVRRQAFPLFYLLLAIPLPWLESGTPYLARAVAQVAARMVSALGIPVLIEGARITLPQAALVVGAPCSGVNSLAALLTLAVLYAFLVCGPVASRLALVVLSLPIALLANLVRVFLVIVLAHWVSLDAAMTYFHGWSIPTSSGTGASGHRRCPDLAKAVCLPRGDLADAGGGGLARVRLPRRCWRLVSDHAE